MNIVRSAAASMAALALSSGCGDVLEGSTQSPAYATDASPDVGHLSSKIQQDIAASCSGFTLTAMPDMKTGNTPISQEVIRGDYVELGCWHIENPCDQPLVTDHMTFARKGLAPMGQFIDRYIPKTSDTRVIDPKSRKVTFTDGPISFPEKSGWDFCISGTVANDAICDAPTTFLVDSAEDMHLTYDGKPVTSKDFSNTAFPVAGGVTTVDCGVKFVDAKLSASNATLSSAPIGSTVDCLDVDIVSNGNYMTRLHSLQIDVERQASTPASAEGGLLDTSNPGQVNQITTNVGPIAITKTMNGDSNPVGVTLSFYGNDDLVQWPYVLGNSEAALLFPQTQETLTFSVGIGNVKLLIGEKIRCIFKSKPVITKVAIDNTPSDPLDPSLIGPEKDIVGPWITITK